MAKRTTRVTGRFRCKDDDGNEHEVVEYQHYVIVEELNRQPEELPAEKEYRLLAGGAVMRIDDSTFRIVANNKILRKK